MLLIENTQYRVGDCAGFTRLERNIIRVVIERESSTVISAFRGREREGEEVLEP